MNHVIRSIRADEWPAVKELRLAALRDPVAHLAFLETYEQSAARPDSFWRERAAGAAEGDGARQFVAVGPDGGGRVPWSCWSRRPGSRTSSMP